MAHYKKPAAIGTHVVLEQLAELRGLIHQIERRISDIETELREARERREAIDKAPLRPSPFVVRQ
jgi:hypothetical protein